MTEWYQKNNPKSSFLAPTGEPSDGCPVGMNKYCDKIPIDIKNLVDRLGLGYVAYYYSLPPEETIQFFEESFRDQVASKNILRYNSFIAKPVPTKKGINFYYAGTIYMKQNIAFIMTFSHEIYKGSVFLLSANTEMTARFVLFFNDLKLFAINYWSRVQQ